MYTNGERPETDPLSRYKFFMELSGPLVDFRTYGSLNKYIHGPVRGMYVYFGIRSGCKNYMCLLWCDYNNELDGAAGVEKQC